ncbi:MAG: phosphate signaling complex protein PhoU [Planctomycetota bacterium]
MTRFQQVLDDILEKLSNQSRHVEFMVQQGLKALETHSVNSDNVRELEQLVNQHEIEIEESCLSALALFQPRAGDLRTISTVLKTNGELERIADLALNLIERAEALLEYNNVVIPESLSEMVRYSLKMVEDADQALAYRDVKLARDVCVRDDQLDAMNRDLIQTIASRIERNPETVRADLHIFSASRIIERIGDHATNIAEDVMYMVDGHIQRHQFKLPNVDLSFPVHKPTNQF